MIRILEQRAFDSGKNYVEAAGLHDDSKPTAGIVTGSVFLEVDTGAAFLFDEISGEWCEIGGSSGGGDDA